MLRLSCVAQSYEWGVRGSGSAVARMKSKGEKSAIDEERPYAEYWFGTHPSGPSHVHIDGAEVPLHDWLLAHPHALGRPPYNSMSALPYLFKVLAVAKALSIQAHPDLKLAAQLHAQHPEHYKDDNHKPEMACALTPFEAMCSFRPLAEVAQNLRRTPELRALLGAEAVAAVEAAAAATGPSADGEGRAALRRAFAALMSRDAAAIAAHTSELAGRLGAPRGSAGSSSDGGSVAPDDVAARLLRDFPGDVGVFAPYLLNVLRLRPGEAIFLAANEPHAYLSGDCMEVMACSDNVVRAGLTPKWKDVSTLVSMLTYAPGAPAVLAGDTVDAFTAVYPTPVPEFMLLRTELPPAIAGATELAPYSLPAPTSAAIIVVVAGSARAQATFTDTGAPAGSVLFEEGQVWLQPANVNVALMSALGVQLFRAQANFS